MTTNAVQGAMVLYVLGVLAFAGYTLHGLRFIAKDDDPESRDLHAEMAHFKHDSGLRDTGIAVFVGIIWPVAFVAYARESLRR